MLESGGDVGEWRRRLEGDFATCLLCNSDDNYCIRTAQ